MEYQTNHAPDLGTVGSVHLQPLNPDLAWVTPGGGLGVVGPMRVQGTTRGAAWQDTVQVEQEGAFARSVRPHQRHTFASLNGQPEVVKCLASIWILVAEVMEPDRCR